MAAIPAVEAARIQQRRDEDSSREEEEEEEGREEDQHLEPRRAEARASASSPRRSPAEAVGGMRMRRDGREMEARSNWHWY